eukprot:6185580-Pleurochrysis_carterae.AAC.7
MRARAFEERSSSGVCAEFRPQHVSRPTRQDSMARRALSSVLSRRHSSNSRICRQVETSAHYARGHASVQRASQTPRHTKRTFRPRLT